MKNWTLHKKLAMAALALFMLAGLMGIVAIWAGSGEMGGTAGVLAGMGVVLGVASAVAALGSDF